MRDQETDFACLVEESDELRPMRLRYGVAAHEASHHEPLDVSLSQEETDLMVEDDGVWDDVDPAPPGLARTLSSGAPDDLDEEQVAMAAERDAMHSIGAVGSR